MIKIITELTELVQTLKGRLPEYLQGFGIDDPFKKFKCIAQDHSDSSPSMQMHKDGTFVKCFSCEKSFDIFAAANELEGFPLDGQEFLTGNVFKLAEKFNIKYSITSSNSERLALKQNYFRAYRIVSEFIMQTAKESPTEAFVKEISKRKWKTKESIELGLGCVNNFKDIQAILNVNGFTKEFMDLAGLMRADLFNSDNLLFTVYDEFNRPIAFYARDTRFEEKKLAYEKHSVMDLSKPKPPMKFNSTANFTGIYEKSSCPYGINDIKNFHKVILVEGHGCKHSLRLAGIDNVIALGGLAFNENLVAKLSSLGVTNLIFMLDSDEKGQEKMKSIIRQFYGKFPFDVNVIDLASSYPDVKDPDEFLRKHTVDAFKQIIEKNALEWYAVSELFDKGDAYVVLQDIIPIIALERSPINRRRIETIISDITGLDKQDIHDEVEQKITMSKDRKSEIALKVFDEAREILVMNPDAYEAAVNLLQTRLGGMNKNENNDELYSSNEVLRELAKRQEMQDNGVDDPMILTGWEDFDKNIQLPTEEAFCLIPGAPNTGKSTLCLCAALGVLQSNNDTIVIIHSTDDSRNVYFDRMVAALAKIKINWVKKPKLYLDEELQKRRNDAYKELTEYIRNDRLIIKDTIHGDSVEYHGKLVSHYREKYPNKKIFVVCDNFHRLKTEVGYEDSRLKYKYISGMMKDFTTKYGVVEFCTVEMNKMNMYTRHTTPETISEAGSIQYDCNLIIFLYNEINALREEATMTFQGTLLEKHPSEEGYLLKTVTKPIIEALILKNKVSEFKGSLFFKMHPELAIYTPIAEEEVKELVKNNSQQQVVTVTASSDKPEPIVSSTNIQKRRGRPPKIG